LMDFAVPVDDQHGREGRIQIFRVIVETHPDRN
jgi:hypothetical protein